MNNIELKKKAATTELQSAEFLKIEKLVKEEKDLRKVSEKILDDAFSSNDILKKDSIERFIDFVLLRVRTGSYHIQSLAFPTKRMNDRELEEKVISLINIYLNPEIVFPVLKYFARNVKDADRNLFLAYLINSDDIIKAIFNTFLLFKKDIFNPDQMKRTLNVKRIQQFSPTADNKFSSPLDAACRFKYILEFIALKQNVEHIYTAENIKVSV